MKNTCQWKTNNNAWRYEPSFNRSIINWLLSACSPQTSSQGLFSIWTSQDWVRPEAFINWLHSQEFIRKTILFRRSDQLFNSLHKLNIYALYGTRWRWLESDDETYSPSNQFDYRWCKAIPSLQGNFYIWNEETTEKYRVYDGGEETFDFNVYCGKNEAVATENAEHAAAPPVLTAKRGTAWVD